MSTLMKQLEMRLGEKRAPAVPYKGPDKKSANGNRPLTFPTPYHGGKRRWAEEILRAFGPERECVYVEPFSGSAAVLLANERPYAREILCDTNPHITNVFRALAWAPEETAFWADWPTIHQDLTSRHTWLLRWAVDNVARIESDPDFYDAKAAGWWLWGKSNWIGSEFGIVKGLTVAESDTEGADAAEIAPSGQRPGLQAKSGGMGISAQRYDAGMPVAPQLPPDKRPFVQKGGGSGVSAQRYADGMPSAPDKDRQGAPMKMPYGQTDLRPYVDGKGAGGTGIQAARTTLPVAPDAPLDKIPHVKEITAGRGVSAQRHGDILYGGGKGYQPQLPPDKIPMIEPKMGGQGIQSQRYDDSLPVAPPDKRPHVKDKGFSGEGVQAQRKTLPTPPDKRPQVGIHPHGQGVSALRKDDTLPQVDGNFASPHAPDKRPSIPGHGPVGIQSHSRDIDSITAPDGIPHVGKGVGGPTAQGVQTQRTTIDKWNPNKIPHIAQNHGGIGISAQREGIADDGPPDATHGARAGIGQARQIQQEVPYYLRQTPVPLTGDRLKPWFIALAQRLYRVIILNRGWQSGLTPTVLQQTRTARKPPVRVLLDPPYKGVGKLYGMSESEADALAIASWEWALENGSRPTWRIAYSCREGDFDEVALAHGWTSSKMGISANHNDNTQEVIWFSPYCIR